MLQELEPKRLIGSMMSVATETGEDWIHLVYFDEAGVFEITDDGLNTRLALTRALAFSLVALLRVAYAQFNFLHGQAEQWHSAESPGAIRMRAEASRDHVVVTWPCDAGGVHRRNAEGQVRLELRADVGMALEHALVASLAKLAAGVATSP